MAHGTAYSLTKSALVARLAARPGLQDVAVSYQPPTGAPDVQARGSHEAIFLDAADGSLDNVVLTAGNLRFDEAIEVQLVAQVLLGTSSGTQRAADERAEALIYEVHAELAAQNTWPMADLGLDIFDYYQVTPASQQWVTGFLPSGAGHAARCELGLLVEARRSFP